MAFLAAFPYGGPPGSVTLERTATPYAKEVLLEDQYQSESSSHSASAMRPVLVELNRLANRYGIGRTQVGVPLSVLTAALNEDPSGFLARSVAAYVRVRHAPYFGLQRCHMHYDCWPYSYGRVQYDPTRGVKGWPGFLARYSRAPGANDASYRLGRDEELLGHYGRAVVAFNHGLSLPAGGTAYDLAVREVWVLDTEMTPEGLSRLYASLPKTQRILRLRVLYSLGVDLLRSGAYAQAQATLTHVAHAIGSASLAPAPGVGTWPFAAAVRVQAMQAGDLARLTDEAKTARTPAARAQIEYDIAAFMYHRTLLFYNQLWAGREQSYFFQGYQPPVATPAFVAYEERENNYVQAADRFHALQASWVPQAIRARALFSYGMSLYRLGGYGIDASVLASPSALAAATANAFGAYARTYPDRALAPEALTLEAAFTRDRGLLNTLVKRYGTTPQGRDAATDLRQTPWPASDVMTVGLSVPSREIYQDTPGVPKSILMWADAKGPVVEARSLGPVVTDRDI